MKMVVDFRKENLDLIEELAEFQGLPKGDKNIRMGQVFGNVLVLYDVLLHLAKGEAKITIEIGGELVVNSKDLREFLLKMRRYPASR